MRWGEERKKSDSDVEMVEKTRDRWEEYLEYEVSEVKEKERKKVKYGERRGNENVGWREKREGERN